MNKFTIVSLCFLMCFCAENNQHRAMKDEGVQKHEWTEEQKRVYFNDSIANRTYGTAEGLNDFHTFSATMLEDVKAKNRNSALIYAFEEPYIDSTQIPSNKFWFRITVNPVFRIPYCLIAEKKNRRTYLTAKMTNGRGGYYSGTLDFSTTTTFSDSLYNDISRELHEINFWKLDSDNIERGLDGEMWTIEAIEHGQYNLVYRWVPQAYGDDTTKRLGRLGLRLRETSKLLDVLGVVNNLEKEQLDLQREY